MTCLVFIGPLTLIFNPLYPRVTLRRPGPLTRDLGARQIVDREVVHSEAEARRNTHIRDAMREKCVPQLVEAWLATLNTYAGPHPQLACMCLEVVGKYVSWIDIGLVRAAGARW